VSDFFRVYRGLVLDDGTQFLTGLGPPGAAGDTAAAPIGSLFVDNVTGENWSKFATGTGTDKWTLLATQEWIMSNGNPEDVFLRAFIGKDAGGSEMPDYTSETYITDGDSLETAIGKLDGELTVISKESTVNTITTFATVDSVLTTMAEWNVQVIDSNNSLNRQAAKVFAIHNGTDVDFTIYGNLVTGVGIVGVDYEVTLSGGNTLNLRVSASSDVDVTTKRITAL
jgi:hypothetical protein